MGTGPRPLNNPVRAVLDTNVLVSALVFRSRSMLWLPRCWKEGILIPLASAPTLSELSETFVSPKFDLNPAEIRGLLADYIPWCNFIELAEPPPIPDCRDPYDRPFLELALAAQADLLVSGDSDLLVLRQVFPIPIVTPQELRSRLSVSGR